MRAMIMIVIGLALATAATAQDLGPQAPAKTPQAYPENIPHPTLQGGDTIANATNIPALPYNDSGTTVGYTDDYDAICPYSGATAPDVVYRIVATSTYTTCIDLCGSSYDTKIYVYDASLNVIACNDDYYFGPPCGTYVSKIESVTLNAGGTYYIVIDGYGAASGAYVMDVGSCGSPCIVHCPPESQPEGEPPLVEDYVDNYNGGCNTGPGFPFQEIAGDVNGEAVLCGVSGWYDFNGSQYRDTDWYLLTKGPSGSIEITADAEIQTDIFELGPQDCAAVGVIQQATAGPCVEASMTVSGYAAGAPVWFWAGPTVFSPPEGGEYEYTYVVWFSGLEPAVATETTTWSIIKALYK